MPRLPKDYSKGLMYKLCCKDTTIKEIYVGSSTNFTQRKRGHKSSCNNPNGKQYNLKVYKFIRENGGFQNWNMVLIEYFPCETELELGRREDYWKQELQSSLNTYSPHIYETKQEAQHKYRENNKEKAVEYHKVWRETNKEYKAEKDKEYYQKNKDKMNEINKKYHQNNKEKIAEKAKEWRELNKEIIVEKDKKRYEVKKVEIAEKRKENINCECGCVVRKGNMKRHKTSAKHLSILEKQNQRD